MEVHKLPDIEKLGDMQEPVEIPELIEIQKLVDFQLTNFLLANQGFTARYHVDVDSSETKLTPALVLAELAYSS